jgi:CBS domain-containing protein/sporulation protein YlmC with PRC-barrel domain
MAELLFLTELVGLKVDDLKGRPIGRVKDAALVPVVHPSRVDRFLIGGGLSWLTVRHDQVQSIGLEGLVLRDVQLTPYRDDEYMLRLVQDLLDQQIIDVHGRKVFRVSDLTFEIRRADDHDELHVRDVDIGVRSVLRRVAQGVVPPLWVRRLQRPIPPQSIDWRYCNMVEPDPQRRVRLNISFDQLADLHPADIADIVEDLGPEEREAIISTLDEEVAAEALSEIEPEMQASIIESLEPEKAADIIEEMAPDEAADALGELEDQTADEILEEMEPESKTEVAELLEFPARSAGGLMNTEYVAVPEAGTVADALAEIRHHPELIDTLSAVYLVDPDGRLTGAVPVARLFLAEHAQAVKVLAPEAVPPHVSTTERQDRVVDQFDKYNLLALPVVTESGALAGVITADDIISALREH